MKTTLKQFITERNTELKLNAKAYKNSFENKDSQGNTFINTVISLGTDTEVQDYDDEGNEIQKPVFVNISLSKAMSEEVGDNFSVDWIFSNPNARVEIDPMYPNTAKVIKEGGEDISAKLTKFLR